MNMFTKITYCQYFFADFKESVLLSTTVHHLCVTFHSFKIQPIWFCKFFTSLTYTDRPVMTKLLPPTLKPGRFISRLFMLGVSPPLTYSFVERCFFIATA